MGKPSRELDPAMAKVLALFEQSGKTLDRLGVEMGYGADVARKAAWQFLRKTADPRVSMLRRFAKAMGVPLSDLITEEGKSEGMNKRARNGGRK